MKRLSRVAVGLAVAVCMTGMSMSSVFASPKYDVSGAATNNVIATEYYSSTSSSRVIGTAVCTARIHMNLRDTPYTTGKIVGYLPAGAEVNVYSRFGSWYLIEYNGVNCWAHSDYLRYSAGSSTTTPSTGEAMGTAVCTAKTKLNLRNNPSASGSIAGTLPGGATVDVLAMDGDWYQIEYNGKNYWAHSDYLNYTPGSSTPTPTPDPSPSEFNYESYPVPENNRLEGKTVFIDPGHGTGAGGAYADYVEAPVVLEYAKLLQENLENSGATVIMTRTTADNVHNYARVAMVNAYTMQKLLDATPASNTAKRRELEDLISKMNSVIANPTLSETYFLSPYDTADGRPVHPDTAKIFNYQKDSMFDDMIYISIHTNAPGGSNTTVNGTMLYYMDNDINDEYYTGYRENDSLQLSRELMDEVTASGGFNEREIVANDFFMVREINIPAALVEIGYHTNASDRAKLTDPTNQKRVANGMAFAIYSYFGV